MTDMQPLLALLDSDPAAGILAVAKSMRQEIADSRAEGAYLGGDPRHLALLGEVADWLDVVAHDVSRPGFDAGWMRVYDQAFVVARAYLGGGS